MIRVLRRRHLAIWFALALLLPMLLVVAWRARRGVPVEPLPAVLAPDARPADDLSGAGR